MQQMPAGSLTRVSRKFLTARADRDEFRDQGQLPEGLRLPGDHPFL